MDPQTFEHKREKMIETQISTRGVNDKLVVSAMLKVERHLFVPSENMVHAYEDSPLPIGAGQTISQPFIVAFMSALLKLDKDKKVLEIGTGSGYQTAILAELAGQVFSLELIAQIGIEAFELLYKLNYRNIRVKISDGYQGWQENAPFDRIIVTCSPTKIPEPLIEQLAEDGIMVIPIGEHYIQELVVITKKNGKITQKGVTGVRFVPMKDNDGNKY